MMAQTTTVTGTIVDPQGNPYASGTVSAIKSVATGQNPGTPVAGTTSIVGTFSITLPSPASYIFTVCASPTQIGPTGNPTPTQVCFSNNTPIAVSGGSQDVSSSLNAVAKVLGPNITGVSGVVSTCSANQVPFYAVNGNVVACSSVITISGTTATIQNEIVTGNEAVTGTFSVGSTSTFTGAMTLSTATLSGLLTANGGLTTTTTTSTGAGNHSGTETFTGSATTVTDLNSTKYVDGTKYATLAAAFATCGTSCIVDMRGPSASTALGTFDPGAVSTTLLLGPYTYTINQITIRPNLRILGTTPVTGINGAPATTLNATGGNATPPFVLAQVCGVTSVVMSDFALAGTAANTTQNGFNLIAPNCGGLWYSKFENVVLNGFGGISWNFDAQTNGAIHQFLNFDRVGAFRTTNGNYALQIIGRANSFLFRNCEFDGIFNTQDGKTNINIAEGTNTIGSPYNINFDVLTDQYAGVGMIVNGADSVTINQPHFELIEGILLTNNGSNFGAMNITMHDGGAFTNSGIGTVGGLGVGNGYIVKNNAGTPNASVSLVNFHPFNAPDNLFLGNTGSISNWGMCSGPGGTCTQVIPTFFANPIGLKIGNGTAVLGTTIINTLTCAAAITVVSGNVLATDSIEWAFNAAPPATYNGLTIQPQAGNGSVLFYVCNPTTGNITPTAATLNWRVIR